MSERTTVVVTIDGMTYPLDLGNLTGREFGAIKRITGVEGVNGIASAIIAVDLEMFAAVAAIAMQRSGIATVDVEKLLDLPLGGIKIDYSFAAEEDPTPARAETPETDGHQPSPTTSA